MLIALVANRSNTNAQDDRETLASTEIGDFKEVAVMGGVQRKNLSNDFRGGEATAVMGGVDIDLRDATMERSEAVLDVSSVMGGVKIRVPEAWTVVSHVSTIMGGFKDDTRRPASEEHRLILKGTVLMGGLRVSN
jgi:predicted membrane protein